VIEVVREGNLDTMTHPQLIDEHLEQAGVDVRIGIAAWAGRSMSFVPGHRPP
jgi:hypothetical protein